MKRFLMVSFAVAGVMLVACGGGDKKTAEPTKKPAATAEATAEKAKATEVVEEPTTRASGRATDGVGAVSSVFSSLFQGGTSGGGALSGAGSGDESLKAYLPDEADFPSGYTSLGSFAYSTPAGSSDLGAVDMAMTMAMKGDPNAFAGADPSNLDLSSIEMLMAAVMKPEDLQALGEAFGDLSGLSAEDIQEQMDAALGEMQGFEVKRFEVLDASGLGDGGFGMEMTIDMSGLNDLIGAFGEGEDAPTFGSMTMRMYVFARGDYMGAVMRLAFADSLGGSSEDLDLAGIIDANLEDAPGA